MLVFVKAVQMVVRMNVAVVRVAVRVQQIRIFEQFAVG